jgi:A/G-specific adenine glycosylase
VVRAHEVDGARLQASLLAWYDRYGRDLAFRRLTDPYAIWLAETMSQQTQIGRVEEALPPFLARFPDVATLARASAGELLRAWDRLGYPRRALALREAARSILVHFGGRIPRDVPDLERLPGIGPYTARAVAATAYHVPVTALDVNARRVLSRVLGLDGVAVATTRAFGARADSLAPSGRAADWNHALMDLGATICLPRPGCAACPLRSVCSHAAYSQVTAPGPPRRRVRATTTPRPAFRTTNRYARGRVLARLRDQPPGSWSSIDPAALSLEPGRLEHALAELEREGLIERDAAGDARLPMT